MNKQEVIEEIKTCKSEYDSNSRDAWCYEKGFEDARSSALNIVKQLDEPEKPVVPQFVADYIDSEQHSCSTLSEAIDNMDDERHILDWFYVNTETFAKAWLYGYEVEKEKLYTVELPNPNSPEHFVLRKNGVNKIVVDCYLSDNWKLYKNTWLTESEIKKDFEWAWQLAKEVEE